MATNLAGKTTPARARLAKQTDLTAVAGQAGVSATARTEVFAMAPAATGCATRMEAEACAVVQVGRVHTLEQAAKTHMTPQVAQTDTC